MRPPRNFPSRAKFTLTIMDPLEPNDPLWKLLGRVRRVEPRSNFTQNVLRAARQTPQSRGWWAAVGEWFADHPSALARAAVAASAVVVTGALVTLQLRPNAASQSQLAQQQQPAAPAHATVVEAAEPPILPLDTQLESMDQVTALLALEDASKLTDSEINFLLY